MYTVQQLQNALERKGYQFFTNRYAYNVNIIGVRTANEITNLFDDFLYLVYATEVGGEYHIKRYPITTHPGSYFFEPGKKRKWNLPQSGVAIMKPGQYLDAYHYGVMHPHSTHSQHCLVQRGNITVFRDPAINYNGDNARFPFNPNKLTTQSGIFGIEIHHAGEDSPRIEDWSAGCQVFQNLADFDEFKRIFRSQNFPYYTYTLIMADDVHE